MSFTFGFYNSINEDRLYDAIQVSKIFDGIIRDGVYATIGDGFTVQASTEENLVIVGPGRAWFNHTWNENDGYLDVNLGSSEAILDRIDAVIIDVDNRWSVRMNQILVVHGTPSSTPARPSLIKEPEHNQYPLCYILRKANSTVVDQAQITNTVGTSECPFVTGVLETLDADLMLLQWRGAWDQFIEGCTANLEEYLDALEQRCDTIVSDTEEWQTAQKEDFNAFYNEFKRKTEEYDQKVMDWIDDITRLVSENDLTTLIAEMVKLKEDLINLIAEIEPEIKRLNEVILGFQSKVTTFSEDGNTITETLDDGSKIVTKFLENGNIETSMISSKGITSISKVTEFKEDGSIVEVVSRKGGE